LIMVDDVQLMDEASSDLLLRLSESLASRRWLLVVTRRDHATGLVPPASTLTVHPRALAADDALQLVSAARGSVLLPREMMQALSAKGGGNPMFLETLAQTVDDSGDVDDLPESIEELATTEIDRLAPGDRNVLRYAAVLGVSFPLTVLQGLLEREGLALDGRSMRVLARFLHREPGNRIGFRHEVMRAVAYEGLSFHRRRQLHEQAGVALEATAAGGDPMPELLSLHFFHAGRYDKAWTYSREAGLRARAKFANHEAVGFLTRAAESAQRAPAATMDETEVAAVWELTGDTWFTIGLPDRAAQAYARAHRQVRGDHLRACAVIAKQARVDQRLRKFPQSLRRLTGGLTLLTELTTPEAHRVRSALLVRYAISRLSQGRVDDAVHWGNLAAREAEDAVDRAALAQAYATLHGIFVAVEREEDMPYGQLALTAYVELDDPTGQAHCLNNLAVYAYQHNRWTEAAETYRNAAAIFRRIGDTANEENAVFNRAELLVRQGRWQDAQPLLQEVLDTARAVSDEELLALALRESGRAACRAGRTDEGTGRLLEARETFARLGEDDEVAATDIARAEASLLAGDPQTALDLTSSSSLEAADPALTATCHRIRGFALAGLGRRDQAGEEFDAALTAGRARQDLYEVAISTLGRLRGSRGATDNGAKQQALDTLARLDVKHAPIPAQRRDVAEARRAATPAPTKRLTGNSPGGR
ncbi:MAG: tetratricopeptide repeat protein, partial [Nocardioidaceae bacterium]